MLLDPYIFVPVLNTEKQLCSDHRISAKIIIAAELFKHILIQTLFQKRCGFLFLDTGGIIGYDPVISGEMHRKVLLCILHHLQNAALYRNVPYLLMIHFVHIQTAP